MKETSPMNKRTTSLIALLSTFSLSSTPQFIRQELALQQCKLTAIEAHCDTIRTLHIALETPPPPFILSQNTKESLQDFHKLLAQLISGCDSGDDMNVQHATSNAMQITQLTPSTTTRTLLLNEDKYLEIRAELSKTNAILNEIMQQTTAEIKKLTERGAASGAV